jgi:hypothetical protein
MLSDVGFAPTVNLDGDVGGMRFRFLPAIELS